MRAIIDLATAEEVVFTAAKPYVPGYAARLAGEFVNFLGSGLTVDAHDALVFDLKEEDIDDSSNRPGLVADDGG